MVPGHTFNWLSLVGTELFMASIKKHKFNVSVQRKQLHASYVALKQLLLYFVVSHLKQLKPLVPVSNSDE
jgi:hypothetical protein